LHSGKPAEVQTTLRWPLAMLGSKRARNSSARTMAEEMLKSTSKECEAGA